MSGIDFTNRLGRDRFTTNQVYLNGSGVAAGDIDGDGWVDLYFCSLDGNNVLYRNLGNWKFQDVTESAGVACAGLASTGAAFADLDGDGHLDLVVNTIGGGTHLFLNDGRGKFRPWTILNPGRGGMSMALADIDGDGDLDLYVTNYRTSTVRDDPNPRIRGDFAAGRMIVTHVNNRPVTEPDLVGRFTLDPGGRVLEHGEVDVLFRNDGNGKFTSIDFGGGSFLDETGKPLATLPYDWGLSVMFRDMTGNGLPDLYVCNDFHSEDRIWINQGNGRFQAIPRLALRQTSLFSMGIDFADLDRDGFDDFFVADMLSRSHLNRQRQVGDVAPLILPIGAIDNRPQYSRNTLFRNRGDGTWAEIGRFAGVEASEWSWASIFLDVDLDGYEDLIITTGHELEMMDADVIEQAELAKSRKRMSRMELLNLRHMFNRFAISNVAFRNRGDLTFEEKTEAWGLGAVEVAHGMALADLDNDGDLDLVINNLNGQAGIYRNDASAPRVGVRLKGELPNRSGIGARITLFDGAVPLQSQEMIAGGRYLSSDDPMRVFAAGRPDNDRMRLEVAWRSGRKSVVEGVRANRIYEIAESATPAAVRERPAAVEPLFSDESQKINHTHVEEEFDDFARQPLLINRLSQAGPGVTWHDFDGDGWDDLIIPSGRGGRLAVLRNDGAGNFSPLTGAPLNRVVGRDQTTVLGIGGTLFIGSANYEDGSSAGGSISIMDLAEKVSGESVLRPVSSTGPLAMGDVDGDGDLDLFVGGRVNAGRYPESATSLLLLNEGGRFVPAQRFENLGLVSGAVFSDLDGDGTPELILACEWGPVRVLKRQGKEFVEITARLGLEKFTGWWNGVATGDLDGDGRPDIIATNWGLNTRYRTSAGHPYRVYYGDLTGDGFHELIEARHEDEIGKEVPLRSYRPVVQALPFLRDVVQTHEAYGRASVAELLGENLQKMNALQVTTFASMVFFNRGDHFEAVELPGEAQLAPAFAVCVADMNGDGHEDLFLSQNFFATNPDTARADAGRGLWLRGDGKGGLTAVAGQESGVLVWGEGRGAAVADFDGDGRVDLVVAQNGAPTRLFQNRRAAPGLRVRLRGPALNPTAVGASMRLHFGTHQGPTREVQAGSGYWSQNSAVQVLGVPQKPLEIFVRWPGGRSTASAIPEGAREIEVLMDGQVRQVR